MRLGEMFGNEKKARVVRERDRETKRGRDYIERKKVVRGMKRGGRKRDVK